MLNVVFRLLATIFGRITFSIMYRPSFWLERPISIKASMMDYSEASFFDGAHFAHITDWQAHHRKLRIVKARKDLSRGRLPEAMTLSCYESGLVHNGRMHRP
jgi:hypothetical protein